MQEQNLAAQCQELSEHNDVLRAYAKSLDARLSLKNNVCDEMLAALKSFCDTMNACNATPHLIHPEQTTIKLQHDLAVARTAIIAAGGSVE